MRFSVIAIFLACFFIARFSTEHLRTLSSPDEKINVTVELTNSQPNSRFDREDSAIIVASLSDIQPHRCFKDGCTALQKTNSQILPVYKKSPFEKSEASAVQQCWA